MKSLFAIHFPVTSLSYWAPCPHNLAAKQRCKCCRSKLLPMISCIHQQEAFKAGSFELLRTRLVFSRSRNKGGAVQLQHLEYTNV